MRLLHTFSKLKKLMHLAQVLWQVDSVVWDLDGTLYSNDQLQRYLKERWRAYYSKRKLRSLRDFEVYEKAGLDWHQIVQQVVPKTTKELCLDIEGSVKKDKYLSSQPLITQFFAATTKKQFLFTNSTHQQAIAILKKIGLASPITAFTELITLDDVSDAKPAGVAFNYLAMILAKHKVNKVLYVGDSARSDLAPAVKRKFLTIHITNHQRPFPLADMSFCDGVELFSYLRYLGNSPLRHIL